MKKKLVGIIMGVAMTATTIAAPTAIFADDIDIEDIAVETEADSGEIEQQESVNEDAEIALEVNDDTSEINSVGDGDTASGVTVTDTIFNSESTASLVLTFWIKLVIPEIKTCNNTSRVTSGTSKTEIARGTDATLNLSVMCMAYVDGKRIDIRAYDNLAIYADIYIDDVKVNDTSIELEKKTLVTASKTYTLTDAVMQQYPDAAKVTVKVYSNLQTPANAVLTQSFNLLAPIESNPSVESFRIDGDMLEFIRGEGISSYLRVVLSGPIQENKAPYYAIYIDDKKATESLPLTRNQFNENNYDKKITISPEMTEYLPEGTKFEIKVQNGGETAHSMKELIKC